MPVSAPPVAPTTAQPSTFAARGDAWLAYWAQMVPELNDLQLDVTNKRNQAVAASDAAQTAAQSAGLSAQRADQALAAARALPITPATSISNLTIPAVGGVVVGFLAEDAKAWGIGSSVRWTNRNNINQWMEGRISDFNPGPGGANPRRMTFVVTGLAQGAQGAAAANWAITSAIGAVSQVSDITDYTTDQATRRAEIEAALDIERERIQNLEGGLEYVNTLIPNGAGAVTVDLGGDKTDFLISVIANISAINFIGAPPPGIIKKFTLRLAFNGTPRGIVWPAAVKHAAGTPNLSFAAGKEAVFSFYTDDQGNKYHAFFVGESG